MFFVFGVAAKLFCLFVIVLLGIVTYYTFVIFPAPVCWLAVIPAFMAWGFMRLMGMIDV